MPKNRILVIKLSSFGDIFHALPAVNNLKVALDAEIDWVTQPEYVELVGCFPIVSRVIPYPRRQFLSNLGSLLTAVRAHRYDYVIDLQGLLKSAIVTRLARGAMKIGPSFHREGSRFLYDFVAGPCDKNRHAVDENLDVIRYLGLPVIPVAFPVRFPAPSGQLLPEPRIALIPVSRRANKDWPVDHFIQTGRALRKQEAASLYLFGSPSDRGVCERIRSEVLADGPGTDVVNLAGQTSLTGMGGWLSRMNLVIVNDSGPLHMATALGVPVVTPFGPTDPRRTGPYGQPHRVVTSDVACRPCFARVCRLPKVECMGGITVGQVLNAAREALTKDS